MDRDYIWEGEYGRRSHLIPVFQQLLREQDASSLQMLSLFVNNNPYNLEFEYYDFMSDYRSPWVFNKILQKP